ncbi:hypothetical protein Glove_330g7 [Diversispora epigaea]|uniref:SWIM-type domain-containing protein n=1 Tax=Diversispora epigaea TaxID=1348612 RepID=A0A397HJN8_9GLOM|nr:hypothetical protein Glove_330g7 [Diversispora epigaea]
MENLDETLEANKENLLTAFTSGRLKPGTSQTRLFFVINPFKIMENLDETLEANKENLLTAFTSGAITNGAIKKGAILLKKTENNSPDHTHTIKKSEKLKRSQFVRNLVEQEAIKNYPPSTIVNTIKEYVIEKLDLSSSVKELRRKEVTNIKSKVYKLQNTYLTEDSDTVAKALKIIQRFVCSWKPRYFLSDQSNVKANGIAIAFSGLSKGEQNCEVIFCTVYVIRTWMTKIYETKVQRKIIHALYKITKIGCDELIQQAINECQASTVKHELKRTTVSHHDLIGACHKIIALDTKKQSDAEYIVFEFRTKQISVVGIDFKIIGQIHKFPFPIQQKIVSEVHTVEKRIEKGKDVPVLTSLNCYCLFFRQYLLPCRHIFHNHLYGEKKLLTTNTWEQFQQMFMESGFKFKVYISRELVEIELPKKTEAEKAVKN